MGCLGPADVAGGEQLDAELPLGPRDVLPRSPVRLADLDRHLEIANGSLRVAPEPSKAGTAAVCAQAAVELHHPLVCAVGLVVLPELQVRVAEDDGDLR